MGERAGARGRADGDRRAAPSLAQRRHARARRAATTRKSRSSEFDVQAGDRMLLCSDGLSGVVPPETLEAIIGRRRPLERRARRSSTPPTTPAGPTTSRSRCCRSMWHNLAQLPRYRGPDSESRRARAEGALPRIGARVLLVVRQPAAAAQHLHVRLHVHPRRTTTKDLQPYAVFMFCGLLPWTWFSSSLIEAVGLADLRRQPDQEGAVPGRSAADRQRAGEHGALLPRPADPGRVHDLATQPLARILARPAAGFRSSCWCSSIFTLGLALILSALTVHFRDIRDLLANLLTFWFFATPIIYFYQMASVQQLQAGCSTSIRSSTWRCRTRRSCFSARPRSATCSGCSALGAASIVRVPRRLLALRSAA